MIQDAESSDSGDDGEIIKQLKETFHTTAERNEGTKVQNPRRLCHVLRREASNSAVLSFCVCMYIYLYVCPSRFSAHARFLPTQSALRACVHARTGKKATTVSTALGVEYAVHLHVCLGLHGQH